MGIFRLVTEKLFYNMSIHTNHCLTYRGPS